MVHKANVKIVPLTMITVVNSDLYILLGGYIEFVAFI